MTIFSKQTLDYSDVLYKQMVKRITGEIPSTHKLLEIPLENIFRLLEMYRYDAYYDGTRDNWHIPIVKGLDLARVKVFGMFTQKHVCVDVIEQSLRKIANKDSLSDLERTQLNDFLNTFKDAI